MANQVPNFKIRRTPLDGALAVFLFTAALGVWAAYDRQAAWMKFGLLAAGAGLYYLLAWTPARRWAVATGALSAIAALAALYFLLVHDWTLMPADIGLLNRIGEGWMSVRPQLPLPPVHPNIAGGLIAALAPVALFRAWYAWQERRLDLLLVFLGLGSLAALGLLMTSSRAAWLALAVALGVWVIWEAVPRLGLRLPAAAALLGAGLLLVLITWLAGPHLPEILRSIPGAPSAGSRLDLAVNTLRLVAAYPFTGGGLAAFPGLYSHYIKVVPYFIYGYAHNLYLDIAVEQGLAGLAAWLVILGASLWTVARAGGKAGTPQRTLRGALLAGLLVMGAHGLVDDAFYGMGGTPLLFALPGLAIAARRQPPAPAPGVVRSHGAGARMRKALLGGLLLVGMVGVILARRPLLGAWYTNLGAVAMGRLDLRAYPSDIWIKGENPQQYAPAEALLGRALQAQPKQAIASYRLGLIDMLQDDFAAALPHLEAALAADPGHRGVQKALGYTYAWAGDYDKALPLLRGIPEAVDELEAYPSLWRSKGFPELALRAEEMLALLREEP